MKCHHSLTSSMTTLTAGVQTSALFCKQCPNRGDRSKDLLTSDSGCFLGGWLSDKFGRIKIFFLGALWSLGGGALQAGSINADMFILY